MEATIGRTRGFTIEDSVPKWPLCSYQSGRDLRTKVAVENFCHKRLSTNGLIDNRTKVAVVFGALFQQLPDGWCAVKELQSLGHFFAPEHPAVLHLTAGRLRFIVLDAGGWVDRQNLF